MIKQNMETNKKYIQFVVIEININKTIRRTLCNLTLKHISYLIVS